MFLHSNFEIPKLFYFSSYQGKFTMDNYLAVTLRLKWESSDFGDFPNRISHQDILVIERVGESLMEFTFNILPSQNLHIQI